MGVDLTSVHTPSGTHTVGQAGIQGQITAAVHVNVFSR